MKILRGEISIDDVPEENRETVQILVANKIARWGEYQEQEISSDELGRMIKETL